MSSPFYFYRGWLIYWEIATMCYFAKPRNGHDYIQFGTDAGLGRVCDHIRQRTLAGRVSQ